MTARRVDFSVNLRFARSWDWESPGFDRYRRAWCDWFEHHGINPGEVTVTPGWVEADDDAHTITYLSDVRDADGNMVVKGNWVRRAPRTVQLTEPAAPFPEPLS